LVDSEGGNKNNGRLIRRALELKIKGILTNPNSAARGLPNAKVIATAATVRPSRPEVSRAVKSVVVLFFQNISVASAFGAKQHNQRAESAGSSAVAGDTEQPAKCKKKANFRP